MTRAIATVIAAMVFVLAGGSALAENLQDPGHQDPEEQCWQQGPNGPVLGPCPQDEPEDGPGGFQDPGHQDPEEQCWQLNEHGQAVLGPCPDPDGDPDEGPEEGPDEDPEEDPEDNSGNHNPEHHNPDVRTANPTFTG